MAKLRSALKKMNSFGNYKKKLTRGDSALSSGGTVVATSAVDHSYNVDDGGSNVGGGEVDAATTRLQTVYVGRSRKECHVPAELLDHPVVKELVDCTTTKDEISVMIGCEAVLFDHLRWMLEENPGPQIEPLDDLARFYAY